MIVVSIVITAVATFFITVDKRFNLRLAVLEALLSLTSRQICI